MLFVQFCIKFSLKNTKNPEKNDDFFKQKKISTPPGLGAVCLFAHSRASPDSPFSLVAPNAPNSESSTLNLVYLLVSNWHPANILDPVSE